MCVCVYAGDSTIASALLLSVIHTHIYNSCQIFATLAQVLTSLPLACMDVDVCECVAIGLRSFIALFRKQFKKIEQCY